VVGLAAPSSTTSSLACQNHGGGEFWRGFTLLRWAPWFAYFEINLTVFESWFSLVASTEKYGEGILMTLCESCIYHGKCICLLLRLCSFSCVDRFLFKIWALCVCVKKRHLQDFELEFAYLWYVLLKVARRTRNAKNMVVVSCIAFILSLQ
jgi:hypothetical protein